MFYILCFTISFCCAQLALMKWGTGLGIDGRAVLRYILFAKTGNCVIDVACKKDSKGWPVPVPHS
jgi:hypothetical protein